MTCSCGNPAAHVVARRTSFDGDAILVWDSGAITGAMGFAIEGIPIARPRSSAARITQLAAAWLFADEASLCNTDEIAALYRASVWAAKRGGGADSVRRRLASIVAPRVKPAWTVTRADREGRPVERFWRLPRIRWPGLAVWDHCTPTSGRNNGRASGGAGGCRYELVGIDRNGVCRSTGFRFRNLRELARHLHDQP